MDSSLARLSRAAGAAALSTVAALTLHTVAGGHAPAAAAVLVPLGVSFAVAVQLSGRPLGRLRLAAIAVTSQVAFHLLFTLGSGASPTVMGGHHGTHAVPGEATAHAASMPLAHLGAALITYGGIRRASTLTAALARGLARAVASFRPRATPPVATVTAPRIVPLLTAAAAPTCAAFTRIRPLRGPPVTA